MTPKKQPVVRATLRLPQSLWAAVLHKSIDERVPAAELVARALREFLKKGGRQWAWEDLDGDTIRLRAENAKTGEARVIPLEGELAELIARRRAARQVEIDGTVMISSLIFHRAGQPVGDFRKAWARACKKAGILRLFHDLRRSGCRNMVNAGVPQNIAMKISGHRTDSMFRRYAIVAESDLRTALRRTKDYLKTVQENVVAMPVPGRANGDNSRTVAHRRGRGKAANAWKDGAPWEIRTPDLLVRSQTLYPTELRARGFILNDLQSDCLFKLLHHPSHSW
jgi:Phage integrase family